jgi:hypothetical protein
MRANDLRSLMATIHLRLLLFIELRIANLAVNIFATPCGSDVKAADMKFAYTMKALKTFAPDRFH